MVFKMNTATIVKNSNTNNFLVWEGKLKEKKNNTVNSGFLKSCSFKVELRLPGLNGLRRVSPYSVHPETAQLGKFLIAPVAFEWIQPGVFHQVNTETLVGREALLANRAQANALLSFDVLPLWFDFGRLVSGVDLHVTFALLPVAERFGALNALERRSPARFKLVLFQVLLLHEGFFASDAFEWARLIMPHRVTIQIGNAFERLAAVMAFVKNSCSGWASSGPRIFVCRIGGL